MALLTMMNYGKYENKNAVENVLRYILRIRKNENRARELLAYGGMGVSLYAPPEMMVHEFRYVQNFFQINSRKGRRMHHEVLNLLDSEYRDLGEQVQILYAYALDCCMEYFGKGHQVVFAIHWDREKRLHIHFAINAISYVTGKKWHSSLQETADRGTVFQNLLNDYRAKVKSILSNAQSQNVIESVDGGNVK